MDLGPHAAFVWASYAVVAAVLSGLIAWLVVDGRRQQRLIDELEAVSYTHLTLPTTPYV